MPSFIERQVIESQTENRLRLQLERMNEESLRTQYPLLYKRDIIDPEKQEILTYQNPEKAPLKIGEEVFKYIPPDFELEFEDPNFPSVVGEKERSLDERIERLTK